VGDKDILLNKKRKLELGDWREKRTEGLPIFGGEVKEASEL
jgi:hypothetical protein